MSDADWTARLARVQAQRPSVWAPTEGTITEAERDALAARLGIRDPKGAGYEAVRDAIRAEAAHHEALVRQAGAVVREEVDRRVAAAGIPDVEDLRAQVAAVDARWARAVDPDEAFAAGDESIRLSIELAKAQAVAREVRVRITRDVLAEVRPMGAPAGAAHTYAPRSVMTVRKLVDDAIDYYPTDWAERSIGRSQARALATKSSKRGHYTPQGRSGNAELAVSGGTPAERLSTTLHELGHRMEETVDGVRRLEAAFYRRRVTQADGTIEPNQSLRRLTGLNYNADELARPDDFLDAYMGRDYGGAIDARGNYEVFSTGVEGVFAGRWDGLTGDPDHRDFILGILALV